MSSRVTWVGVVVSPTTVTDASVLSETFREFEPMWETRHALIVGRLKRNCCGRPSR